jgi:hypothetical protein
MIEMLIIVCCLEIPLNNTGEKNPFSEKKNVHNCEKQPFASAEHPQKS